jgi:hypothetical protein
MDLSERQRPIMLIALDDLATTRSGFGDESSGIPITRISFAEIGALAEKLGGDPQAVFFGATLLD